MQCTVVVNFSVVCLVIFVDYHDRKIGVMFFVVHRFILLCTDHCQLKVYGKCFDLSFCAGTLNIVVLVCIF